MRPGQNNNKRMRGRPSNNRRGPNPLTRSYESNGPDVKIRGNAHHVAEKYLQLARDAHTGGDPVAAENYLQHAEHYFRLIATAQAAQAQAQGGGRPGEAETYEIDDEDDVGGLSDRFASPAERIPPPAPYAPPPQPYQQQPNPPAPQPYIERPAGENDRQVQPDRGGYQHPQRQDRQNNNRHQDRGPRPDRPFQGQGQPGRDGRPREFRPYREPNVPRESQNGSESAVAPGLPSFITAAPRITGPQEGEPQPEPMVENVAEATGSVEAAAPAADAPAPDAQGRFPGRGRRRRLRSPYGFHAGSSDEEGGEAPVIADDAPISE